MLEQNPELFARIAGPAQRKVQELNVDQSATGLLARLVTSTGNIYLFEIIKAGRVNLVNCRSGKLEADVEVIGGVIEVGQPVNFRHGQRPGNTTTIRSIEII